MTTTNVVAKKAVKKVAKKVVINKAPVATKLYQVTMRFNGEVFDFETDNLADSISMVKPVTLKTPITFTATKEGKVCERYLLLNRGKLLFRNKFTIMVFVQTLLFK